MRLGQHDALVEGIARLADRTYHIILLLRLIAVEVDDLVMGIVEGRTNEVGETCIHNGELLHRALLHVVDLGDEGTTLGDYCTSKLEVYRLSWSHLQILLMCNLQDIEKMQFFDEQGQIIHQYFVLLSF